MFSCWLLDMMSVSRCNAPDQSGEYTRWLWAKVGMPSLAAWRRYFNLH